MSLQIVKREVKAKRKKPVESRAKALWESPLAEWEPQK